MGLILDPDLDKGFECMATADFAGNWNPNFANDTSGAYSRTGYVISYAGCPVIWGSKIHKLVAISTTESERITF
jgi:hypothetical protein